MPTSETRQMLGETSRDLPKLVRIGSVQGDFQNRHLWVEVEN